MDDLARYTALEPLVERETWESLWPACKPLMLAHKEELGQTDSRTSLVPDHQKIRRLEEAGGLFILSARTPERSLVGYLLWYLMPSLETSGLMLAQQGPWYVTPSWRTSRLGARLWEESERWLGEAEVRLLQTHYPKATPGLRKFFERKGGREVGTMMEIWLR